MKQTKLLFLVTIVLLAVLLTGCPFGGAQATGGWSGTAFRDGIVYAGTMDGAVVAINATTRAPLWPEPHRVTMPAEGLRCGPAAVAAPLYASPAAVGDIVYVGTYAGEVLALNSAARSQDLPFPHRGMGEWKHELDTGRASGGVVAELAIGDEAVYASASDGRVYALSRGFGDRLARSDILDERHRKLWTAPVVHDGVLYVSTFDGHIRVLSADTLALLDWSFASEAGFASPPVVHDGTIYVGSFDNHLYAIQVGADEPLWRFSGGGWFWATPVVHNAVVYAACLDGRLYVIDAGTGTELGAFDAGFPIVSSPVVMDDLLIVVDEAGFVRAFDLNAAPEALDVPVRPAVGINAAVRSAFSAQDGMVYIRAENNRLYAVDIVQGWVDWDVALGGQE